MHAVVKQYQSCSFLLTLTIPSLHFVLVNYNISVLVGTQNFLKISWWT